MFNNKKEVNALRSNRGKSHKSGHGYLANEQRLSGTKIQKKERKTILSWQGQGQGGGEGIR